MDMSASSLGSTGVPGLDAVLVGNIRASTLALVVGAPGAGKTVLASQLVFHAARNGIKVLVFTAFSEGLEQYLDHLRAFTFFDPQLVGTMIQVFTLQSLLSMSEEAPATVIARTIRETGARFIVFDGFQGLAPLLPHDYSVQMLLSALAIQIRYLNATLLLTIAGAAREAHFYPELTLADLAIDMVYTVEGRRHVRRLDVIKQRGRAQLPGLHSYQIDSSGIRVFPRIETYPTQSGTPHLAERAGFGLPELDQLLDGGPNVGTTTLFAGAPSTGKTTLGLHWALAEARPDAATLFLTFGEHPEQLLQKSAVFGLDIARALATGALRLIRIAPVDLNPDVVAQQIFDEIADGHIRRVVIDDATLLINELGERTRDYLGALNAMLYGQNSSTLLLYELPAFEGLRMNVMDTPFVGLCDNTIVVQQYEIAGELRRLLAVLRMRFSAYDRTLRELVIDANGVRVLSAQQSANGVLETGANLSGGVAPT